MKRGAIYLVSLDSTEGREQQGFHPVLVVSPAAFNTATKRPVVLPITNGGTSPAGSIAWIETSGVVRCDQPRVLDLEARRGRKIETLPSRFLEVMARVATIFEVAS